MKKLIVCLTLLASCAAWNKPLNEPLDGENLALVEVTPETQSFVPYGTPCSERFDPATQKLELLQCEMLAMQLRLNSLLEERDALAARQSAGRKGKAKTA